MKICSDLVFYAQSASTVISGQNLTSEIGQNVMMEEKYIPTEANLT